MLIENHKNTNPNPSSNSPLHAPTEGTEAKSPSRKAVCISVTGGSTSSSSPLSDCAGISEPDPADTSVSTDSSKTPSRSFPEIDFAAVMDTETEIKPIKIKEEDAKVLNLKLDREAVEFATVEAEKPKKERENNNNNNNNNNNMVQQATDSDGGEWHRGKLLGQGCYGLVHMATVTEPRAPRFKDFPPVMAVKSAHEPYRAELEAEKLLLRRLADCPYVIRYLGDEETTDADGTPRLNVFLEFASGGSLISLMGASKGPLEEGVVRRYTRSILAGVKRIHDEGYVHCDLHPCNVLLVEKGGEMVAKVADFGLSKREGEQRLAKGALYFRAPEGVRFEVQVKPSDIWSLGCIVVRMLGGNMQWDGPIVMPVLPAGLSGEAADFLGKCFAMKPEDRATAEELMSHPFVCPNKGRKVGQRRRSNRWKRWLIPLCTFSCKSYE